MLKVRVIPCMLFNGFSLVKTIRFGEMRNLGNPVQIARVYNSRNVDELIFIDLAATEESREPLYNLVKDIIGECFMPVTIGGGIHTYDQIQRLLDIGADKVSINSEALRNKEFIRGAAERFGNQCIVVSFDCKIVDGVSYVFSDRGTKNTGIEAAAWAGTVEEWGAGEIFVTSIDREGVMDGFDIELAKSIVDTVSIPVIANGGAGKVQHVIDAVTEGGVSAVALSSMLHYSGHTPNSIKQRMRAAGIPVRIVENVASSS